MTGAELIEMIKRNHAENMPVVVQYRDSGGVYEGGEEAEFSLADASGRMYGEYDSIDYSAEKKTVIVL